MKVCDNMIERYLIEEIYVMELGSLLLWLLIYHCQKSTGINLCKLLYQLIYVVID